MLRQSYLEKMMMRTWLTIWLVLFATSAEAACNRAYVEAAIDQRIPGWAIKFRTPDRVNNICTLCSSFEGGEFRACVMEEVEAMAGRARGAARKFFGD